MIVCKVERFKKVGVNEIGQSVREWCVDVVLRGWLDLRNELTNVTTFKSKVEQSTHIFIAKFQEVDTDVRSARFVDHLGRIYELLLIDNVMQMNRHLEIYLKYVGDGDS